MPESKPQTTKIIRSEVDGNAKDQSSLHKLESLLLQSLKAHSSGGVIKVAFSGGLDSKSLLFAVCELRDKGYISEVEALHVDHGIQSESGDWLQTCQKDCKRLGVNLKTTQLAISLNGLPTDEAFAREERYDFFKDNLSKGDCLLFAHHQDDQAETLLFRLLRGCGIKGAAAMPISRQLGLGKLIRPWLNVTKQEIEEYAESNNLNWIEDPSNTDTQYDRNFLRNIVLPNLKERWPAYAKTFARFTALAGAQSDLLDEFSQIDLKECEYSHDSLKVEKFCDLSQLRQRNLLYYWGRLKTPFGPTQSELDESIKQIHASPENAIRVDFAGMHLRTHQGAIYLVSKEQPQMPFDSTEWNNLESNLVLSNDVELRAMPLDEKTELAVRLPRSSEKVLLKMREGGESVLPHYREKSNRLKIIYQECGVPTWRREWLPLIYYDEQLVAVPGVFINKEFTARPDESAIEFHIIE